MAAQTAFTSSLPAWHRTSGYEPPSVGSTQQVTGYAGSRSQKKGCIDLQGQGPGSPPHSQIWVPLHSWMSRAESASALSISHLKAVASLSPNGTEGLQGEATLLQGQQPGSVTQGSHSGWEGTIRKGAARLCSLPEP